MNRRGMRSRIRMRMRRRDLRLEGVWLEQAALQDRDENRDTDKEEGPETEGCLT